MWTNPYALGLAVEQYQQELVDNARRWQVARGARRGRRTDRGHGAARPACQLHATGKFAT